MWPLARGATPTMPVMGPGQGSHGPPPSVQLAGERVSDQQRRTPVLKWTWSFTRSFQLPATTAPGRPRNVLSEPAVRNVPTKGALAEPIAAGALSVKVVRTALEHPVP